MVFGTFGEHLTHAPGAPLFVRREVARRARLTIARRHGRDYPAYLVFDDATLDRLALYWPTSDSLFEGYFGEGRLEAWGRELLRIVADDSDDEDAEEPTSQGAARSVQRTSVVPRSDQRRPAVNVAVRGRRPAATPTRRLGDLLEEEIIPRLAIEDAYDDVTFVIRRGQYWRGGCPLHGGRDPNFAVNVATLSWTCFSHCGHGSYLAYLNGGEPPRGAAFIELVRKLAADVGVEVDSESDADEVGGLASRRSLLDAYVALARESLGTEHGRDVVQYLHNRGFTGDAHELARLGFGVHPSAAALAGMRAKQAELREAGLNSSAWRGRLVIPWLDELGRVATIAARSVGDEEPKYLYLRGTSLPPFFRPSRARRHRIDRELIVAEGLLDAVMLDSAGVDNVVATGGTAIGDGHREWILNSGVGRVTLAMDADDAGVRATRSLISLLQPHGDQVRLAAVPPAAFKGAKDPAAFIEREGRDTAPSLVEARLPVLLWEAEVRLGNASPSSETGIRRTALAELEDLARQAEGPERAANLEDLASLGISRLGYSEAAVRQALGLEAPVLEEVQAPASDGPPSDDVVGVLNAPVGDEWPYPQSLPGPWEPDGACYVSTTVPERVRPRGTPVTYTAEISRTQPTALLFLIDQSGSMADHMSSGKPKSQHVADVLNRTLATLITRCTRAEGVRDYFDIGVIGYGGNGVGNGFGGELRGTILQPVSAIEAAPLRIEERMKKQDDGAGGLVEVSVKFPVWFEANASGGTPMCSAITRAAEELVRWCDTHPDSYPPTVLHITDGASTDGDPEGLAKHLQQIQTSDGPVLVLNLHLSNSGATPIEFPSAESALGDEYARLLFRMSSLIPDHLASIAQGKGFAINSESRGFMFNAEATQLVEFFDIGTRAAQLR